MIKDIRNLCKPKRENEAIKDRINRDIKDLFELENEEEEDYYKPVRVASNFYNKNYIKYESNGDRSKTLSIKEYLHKIKPYLKAIINNLPKSDTRKFHSFKE